MKIGIKLVKEGEFLTLEQSQSMLEQVQEHCWPPSDIELIVSRQFSAEEIQRILVGVSLVEHAERQEFCNLPTE